MNNQTFDNKLLSNYQNYKNYQQGNNAPFNNNMLLQNNPAFMSNINYNDSAQLQQMQYMQNMIKGAQQMKHLEKLNEMEVTMDKEKIKESIIKPIKVERDKKSKQELEIKWKAAESNYRDKSGKDYGSEIKNYWEKRTNRPYKNILKNEDYTKQYKTSDDLIIHKITQTDKNKEKVDGDLKEFQNKIETHDNELKSIYSTSNINEHKKKFEYRHVYKYRIQYDPKDHNDIKQDNIKYYKELQKKEEEGKQQFNSLQKLIDDGIFDKDELSDFKVTKVDDSLNEETKKRDKRESYMSRKNNNKK
jgi:hypothetical protein